MELLIKKDGVSVESKLTSAFGKIAQSSHCI